MRQTGSTDHQRHSIEENIKCPSFLSRILLETKIGKNQVKFIKNMHTTLSHRTSETKLRNGHTCQLHGNKYCRDSISKNQNTVLGNLGVGNTFHTAKYRITKNDSHPDKNTMTKINLQEAGKGHANTLHLTNNVCQRSSNQAKDSRNTCGSRIKTVTDKGRNRVFTIFPEIRSQEHGKQNVAACPTHEENRGVISLEGDKACHGNKRGSRHPVSARCHTIENRMNTLTGNIKLTSSRYSRFDRDKYVEGKGCANYKKGQCFEIHSFPP